MKTLLSLFLGLSLVLVPVVAIAQNAGPNGPNDGDTGGPTGPNPIAQGTVDGLVNPLKVDSIEDFLTAIIDFVVRLGTLVVIVMIVVVGFMFVNARGNPTKIQEAQQALLWVLVGAVILIGAQLIAEAIRATVDAIGS